MSDDHFHVHGPHDHAVEHVDREDGFAGRLAVMTALLSTIGAMFSYQSGATQNAAMVHKNSAAIVKTEAANRWNHYQAKSSKQALSELAVALTGDAKRGQYEQEVARYQQEKTDIKKEADHLEAEVKTLEAKSEASTHCHHRWAQATTAIQIAIAMAAITLLTRKRWLNQATYVAAGVGLILGLLAFLHL